MLISPYLNLSDHLGRTLVATEIKSQPPMVMPPKPAEPVRASLGNREQKAPDSKSDQKSSRSFAEELAVDERKTESKSVKQTDQTNETDTTEANKQQGEKAKTKASLAPIRRVASQNKAAVDATPIVAFLTGHLENVSSDLVPSLVTENKFIEAAFSATDMQAFLNKPMAVGDLVADLGLPEQILQTAVSQGFDPATVVTAADFFKAIGVDPQRISAELKVLKDNVLVEGVSGYLARAKSFEKDPTRMAGIPGEKPKDIPAGLPTEAVPTPMGVKTKVPDSPEVPVISASTPVKGQAPQKSTVAHAQFDPTSFLAIPQQNNLIIPEIMGDEPLLTLPEIEELAEKFGVPPEAIMLAGGPKFLSERNLPKFEEGVTKLTNSQYVPIYQEGVEVKRSGEEAMSNNEPVSREGAVKLSYDPYEAMGALIEKNVELEPVTTRSTTETLLGSRFDPFAVVVPQIADKSELLPAKPDLQVNPKAEIPEFEVKGTLKDAADISSPAKVSDVLLVTQPEAGEQRNSKDSDKEGTREDSAKNREDTPVNGAKVASEFKFGSSSKFEIAAPNQSHNISPAHRQELINRIQDQVSYLTTQGGGVAKIEIKSPELGPITMAIRMENDRVDLRIVASSERAKDTLLNDLTGLGGALTSQSVQLGKVDVGVAGFDQNRSGSPQQQFAGFAEQKQGQREAQEFLAQFTNSPKKAVSILPEPIAQSLKSTPIISAPGRITVRI